VSLFNFKFSIGALISKLEIRSPISNLEIGLCSEVHVILAIELISMMEEFSASVDPYQVIPFAFSI
jgi:hypothetical protein